MKLEEHPTVKRYRKRGKTGHRPSVETIDAGELREVCLEAGADDAGFSSSESPVLNEEARMIKSLFPFVRSLISLVVRLNPESIRSLSRSTSDLEFSHGMRRVDSAALRVASRLRERGVRSLTPAAGFPMDLERWPERMWPVSHKIAAEAAGMGRRGHNRILIHPGFGNFVVLGTLLLDTEISPYDTPLEFNPCLDCRMCASVCPVGAVSPDGYFGFTTCLTHNYRDRLGGFSEWVETVVDSGSAHEYRRRVSDHETVAMWQGMTCGISNKCSYCVAVCPAGDENIGDFIDNRKNYVNNVVKPLQVRKERVYVLSRSDGETHLARTFPHKEARVVGSGIRPASVRGFLRALPHVFNRGPANGLSAVYHFTFTGKEKREATVTIGNMTVKVEAGHVGRPDLRVTADSLTWLKFVAGEMGIMKALLTRKVRIKGPPELMKRFAGCFPM